jgi:hypothetical protein
MRLPPELRQQIYDNLRNDSRSRDYYFPHSDTVFSSRRLIKLPITQVCQLLRRESIPVFYGRVATGITFGPSFKQAQMLPWLQNIDPYALRCSKGIKLMRSQHYCRRPIYSPANLCFDFITIEFKKDGVEIIELVVTECCAKMLEFNISREALITGFRTPSRWQHAMSESGVDKASGRNLQAELWKTISSRTRGRV